MHENIKSIEIDQGGRLIIKPEKKDFDLIYRSGAGVQWDNDNNFLYGPKPEKLSYFDLYFHIIKTVIAEYDCKLTFSDKTEWINIPTELKEKIIGNSE